MSRYPEEHTPVVSDADTIRQLQKGICDLHVHLDPDVRTRSENALDYVRKCAKAGMGAAILKCHDFSTMDLAWLLRQVEPSFEVFGSVCMNWTHGPRVNPATVRAALSCSGHYLRCVWLPTRAARFQSPENGIPVLDEQGKVLPEVVEVMELCAEADIMLASGHCSPDECLALARKAREVGVKKFVVTHADTAMWTQTHEQVMRCLDEDAWIEYAYGWHVLQSGVTSSVPCGILADYIRLAPEKSFVVSDMGMVELPQPAESMQQCVPDLLRCVLSPRDISLVLKENPMRLVHTA